MANIKITDLDAAGSLAATDVVPVVDVSADETKKITATDLFRTLPDGTAAAPALAFSSDAANGVYLAGTDTVGISTGGTQRVTVDGSGNVTISGDLTVSGATTTVESTTVTIDDKNIELGSVASPSNTTADGGGITLKGATDKTLKWINSTGCWTFNQPMNFNDHVRIDSSGNVGIGTSSPTDTNGYGTTLDIRGSGVGNGGVIYLRNSDATVTGQLAVYGDGRMDIGTVTNHPLKFYTFNSERLRIDSSGNVGIGTTSITEKLTVFSNNDTSAVDNGLAVYRSAGDDKVNINCQGGAARFISDGGSSYIPTRFGRYNGTTLVNDVTIDTSGNVGIGNTIPGTFSILAANNLVVGSGSGTEGITVYSGSSNTGRIAFADGTTGNAQYRGIFDYNHSTDAMTFSTAAAERLRIDTTGRVGVGTSSPGTILNIRSNSSDDGILLEKTDGTDIARLFYDGTTTDARLDMFSGGSANIQLRANGVSHFSGGNIGIGTSSPSALLHLSADSSASLLVKNEVSSGPSAPQLQLQNDSGHNFSIKVDRSGTGGFTTIDFNAANTNSNHLIFVNDTSEVMRLDGSGRLLVGTSSQSNSALLTVEGNTGNNSGAGELTLQRGEAATSITANESIGHIYFQDNSNKKFAEIACFADAAAGSNDYPGRLVFSTTADGASSPTERMRIDSSGRVGIGTTSPGVVGVHVRNSSEVFLRLDHSGTNTWDISNDSNLKFARGGTERMRIDSSGRLLVGVSSTSAASTAIFEDNSASNGPSIVYLSSSSTTPADGAGLGLVRFSAANHSPTAQIAARRDGGTWTAGSSQPSRIEFSTTADGASSSTERLRITSTGAWAIEGASNYGASGQVLTSNGNDSPTWQSPSAGAQIIAGNTNVECVDTGSNGHIMFDTEGSERMRIDSSGRVLINTTTEGQADADDLTVAGSGNTGITIRSGTTSHGAIYFSRGTSGNDEYNGFVDYDQDDNYLRFGVAGAERMRIDSSGNIGIGTTSPSQNLHVSAASGTRIQVSHTGGSVDALLGADSGNAFIGTSTNHAFRFITNNAERMRIDSSGRLLVGSSTARSVAGISAQIQLEGTGAPSSSMALIRNTNNTANPYLFFGKTRGSSDGANTLVQNGDYLGAIYFAGADGTDLNNYAAAIYSNVDGTPGSNDMPGRLTFETTSDSSGSSSERMRINKSGQVLIGTTSGHTEARLVIQGQTSNSAVGAILSIQRGQAASSISSGNGLGNIFFTDSAGGKYAAMYVQADGTPGTNDYPGRMIFATTADGASTFSERMRINNNGGIVGFGNTSTFNLTTPGFAFSGSGTSFNGLSLVKNASNWGTALYVSRDNAVGDGTLIEFAQGGATEGSITVNGSTVSYNGGHLSRWSQTLTTDEHVGLLKGTVMTNLDEMCEWAYEAQEEVLYTDDDVLPEGVSVGDVKTPARAAGFEENEQLNKMAVSSVEGDPNVAGVMVNIDDDGDLNVAMTGDMVIRIAQGTTVARGDLLMSAGDGTAKPQDDDIVRSKTIAKVTSTTVSTTYADGSYCVPCVLMAC